MADQREQPNASVLSRVELVRKAAHPQHDPFSEQALAALEERHGVPAIDLSRIRLELSLLDWLPKATAESHCLLPFASEGEQLLVVMANPANARAIEEFQFVTGKDLRIHVASEEALSSLIKQAYQAKRQGEAWFEGQRYERPRQMGHGAAAHGTGRPGPGVVTSVGAPAAAREPAGGAPDEQGQQDMADLAAAIPSLLAGPPTQPRDAGNQPESQTPSTSGVALVVEDDEAIRAMVVLHLKTLGLQVVEARDGQEALDFLAHGQPTIAIVDAMLPRVHGFELIKRMRDDPKQREIPIVVVSAVHRGWRFAEDLRRSSGVRHYIEKPFSAVALLAAVRDALGQEGVPAPGPGARAELERGVDLLRTGQLATAVEVFEAALGKEPDSYLLHYHLGIALERGGRLFEAIAAIERAVALCPRYFVGVKNLAVLYHRAGFQNKSTEMWERALALAPEEKTREAIRSHLLRLF